MSNTPIESPPEPELKRQDIVTEMDPAVFNTTCVLSRPGPAYANETRQFQGIPGIERSANGRLWATWYGGGIDEDRHNYVMLATSADNGTRWTPPVCAIDPDGDGPMRAFDPCLWCDPEGRMWLFWNQKLCNKTGEFSDELERSWYLWGMHTAEADAEHARWSKPRRLCEAIMMNKPVVLSSGDWLLCSADWFWDRSPRVFRSTDCGVTWHYWGCAHVPVKTDRSFDEHMVVERKDGSLWMLVRTQYGIGESMSLDRGETWRYVTPSAIAHVCSRFFLRRLRSGNLILIKHGQEIGQKTEDRRELTAFLSMDDGKTWQGGLMLDERPGVSYPDGTEAADGLISVIYDFNRITDKEILLAQFTEEDILQRTCVFPASRLRVRVNKALGENPRAKSE